MKNTKKGLENCLVINTKDYLKKKQIEKKICKILVL